MTTWLPSSTPFASDLGIRHLSRPQRRTVRAPWLRVLASWIERSRQRRALHDIATMSPHILNDIGVTRLAALEEAEKPFWR
jgi:uncharacterized protein YjiS (DUF1127 family)